MTPTLFLNTDMKIRAGSTSCGAWTPGHPQLLTTARVATHKHRDNGGPGHGAVCERGCLWGEPETTEGAFHAAAAAGDFGGEALISPWGTWGLWPCGLDTEQAQGPEMRERRKGIGFHDPVGRVQLATTSWAWPGPRS